MAKQVPWNKAILEAFIDEAMLTKEEETVMRTRIAGWSRTKQSLELGLSVSAIDKIIARLKKKYDYVAEYNKLLPPRKCNNTWLS